jgi:uncharacterized membrane protein YeaQ/YmgE (transglycosylase-associated protein family)
MTLLWMLSIGLIVGALAKPIAPGGYPGGILVTMLLGIAGAVVAGFLGRWRAYMDQAKELGS